MGVRGFLRSIWTFFKENSKAFQGIIRGFLEGILGSLWETQVLPKEIEGLSEKG